jgi:hypothetical protein
MNNTRLRCMTASAGTIIRRDFSSTHVILLVEFRPLQQMLSSAFGVAGSGFRPLTKILDCCLPLKSGSFSSPVRRYCLSTPLSIPGLVSLYLTNYPQTPCPSFCPSDHACPFSIPEFVGFPPCPHSVALSRVIRLPCTKILLVRSLLICNV